MANDDVFAVITANYNTLTKSGKKIADYIYANKVAAQYLSISTVAKECGVAEATIFRFCQTLGFDGYNEFKLKLAKSGLSHAADGNELYGKIQPGDSFEEMSKKLYTANVDALKQTLELAVEQDFERAAQLLKNAGRVFCFGQGGSLVLAMEAWARFVTISPKFYTIQDSHMQTMTGSLLDAGDVILYVSYSGATKSMPDVLGPARERGAKIILVTHFSDCPAAKYADVVLLCGSHEGPLQSGSIAAKMAILYVIDMLANQYILENYDECMKNREITIQALSNKLL